MKDGNVYCVDNLNIYSWQAVASEIQEESKTLKNMKSNNTNWIKLKQDMENIEKQLKQEIHQHEIEIQKINNLFNFNFASNQINKLSNESTNTDCARRINNCCSNVYRENSSMHVE